MGKSSKVQQCRWQPIRETTKGASHHTDAMQSIWEPRVKFDQKKWQIKVLMAGRHMSDDDVRSWCHWFGAHVETITWGDPSELLATDINFSENQITGIGARVLLETFTRAGIIVQIVKLHRNRIQDGAALAEFITSSCGQLRELHISHNELTAAAAAQIITAAASAEDDIGAFSYPHPRAGCSTLAPLWLRLEKNYIDTPVLFDDLSHTCKDVHRTGAVLCQSMSSSCTPHCCTAYPDRPPAVHVKHLTTQLKVVPPTVCEQEKEEIQGSKADDRNDYPTLLVSNTDEHSKAKWKANVREAMPPAVTKPKAENGQPSPSAEGEPKAGEFACTYTKEFLLSVMLHDRPRDSDIAPEDGKVTVLQCSAVSDVPALKALETSQGDVEPQPESAPELRQKQHPQNVQHQDWSRLQAKPSSAPQQQQHHQQREQKQKQRQQQRQQQTSPPAQSQKRPQQQQPQPQETQESFKDKLLQSILQDLAQRNISSASASSNLQLHEAGARPSPYVFEGRILAPGKW